jgi:Dr1-associated corepressor
LLQDVVPAYSASSSTNASTTGRSRGRPRGSGRGRRSGACGAERDASHYEDDPGASPAHPDEVGPATVLSDSPKEIAAPVGNFDLNMDFSENAPALVGPAGPTGPPPSEMIQETQDEYPAWSVDDMKKMAVDPVQFALTHQKVDEEEEDYDNEEG